MIYKSQPDARRAKIRVPGTTANLGSAFDAVGLALQLYLKLDLVRLDSGPSRLEYSGQDEPMIPADESNLIWRVMTQVAAEHGRPLPFFSLKVTNDIPIAKGLGSSASACLAGIAAADFLCRLQLEAEDLLKTAAMLEGHPDNVAPALYGGLVASISGEPILCSRSAFPSHWTVVAVTPAFELETRKARAVLPGLVSRADAVFNVQRAAFLMAQIVQGRAEGLRQAMTDRLHQPYRSELLPGLREILEMDNLEGLLGVALSGAGSTVVAFADAKAGEIGSLISGVFTRHGLASQVRLLEADNEGMVIET
jgi:homoserine kinase